MSVWRTYYLLTKPGIVRGNLVTAAAGFFVATHTAPDIVRLAALLVGLGLVVASGCVFNNYLDRHLDRHMARTRQRALVTGAVSGRSALLYGMALGLAGAAALLVGANWLATVLAITGWIFYVLVYGYAKRKTVHGTLVGSISGAIPPVVGYAAVSGRLDLAALGLFLILTIWQMPHFYAIAIFRADDYAAAGVPVLPVVKGVGEAKRQILAYIAAFAVIAPALGFLGYASQLYVVVMVAAGLAWLVAGIRGWRTGDERWARRMFGLSLVVITVWSAALVIDGLTPRSNVW